MADQSMSFFVICRVGNIYMEYNEILRDNRSCGLLRVFNFSIMELWL